MKKILTVAVLALASISASAQHHGGNHNRHHGGHHNYGGHHNRNVNWGPVIGGAILGAVVYDIYNRPVIVQQQPPVVYTEQMPAKRCGAWTETYNVNGTVTRSRTCTQ